MQIQRLQHEAGLRELEDMVGELLTEMTATTRVVRASDALLSSLEEDAAALPITWGTIRRLNAEEPYRLKMSFVKVRLARTALVNPQTNMLALHHLHKTDVRALRETFVAFQHRAERFDRRGFHIINLDHAVWVTHRDDAAQYCLLGRPHNIGLFRFVCAKRHGGRLEVRLAHIDAHPGIAVNFRLHHPTVGFHPDFGFFG